jgi:hypothetical protein
MVELIRPYLRGKVLEIYSGDGLMAELIADNGIALRISDAHRLTYQALKQKFEGTQQIKGIHRIDLADETFGKRYEKYIGKLDTVFSLSFTERLYDRGIVGNNARMLLKEKGNLIVLLPVRTAFYTNTTADLEEWRNSNWKDMKTLFGKQSKLIKTEFFILSKIQKSEYPENAFPNGARFFQIENDSVFNQAGLFMIVVLRNN